MQLNGLLLVVASIFVSAAVALPSGITRDEGALESRTTEINEVVRAIPMPDWKRGRVGDNPDWRRGQVGGNGGNPDW
ncbi:hypothetical protein BJ138DRAFT_542888 [Hygrophoropsis aurantiaca]|uniref:Uncharacterized protein n=1 Tax=Hygrophoropsis aurantiaca TaxID=72124 RepID=A0ACB8A1P8_9AGAM|nr:hypothetical protein BJ138DRAFT_542888 [Hygrophoropsis aurantiaca]